MSRLRERIWEGSRPKPFYSIANSETSVPCSRCRDRKGKSDLIVAHRSNLYGKPLRLLWLGLWSLSHLLRRSCSTSDTACLLSESAVQTSLQPTSKTVPRPSHQLSPGSSSLRLGSSHGAIASYPHPINQQLRASSGTRETQNSADSDGQMSTTSLSREALTFHCLRKCIRVETFAPA
jgi:hypothetical protein